MQCRGRGNIVALSDIGLIYDGASVKAEFFFFLHRFSKNSRKKNLNFFSQPFFQKQQKKKLIFFLHRFFIFQNSRKKKFNFFFSTVFPKTAEKKLIFFSPPFFHFPKQQKKKIKFFFCCFHFVCPSPARWRMLPINWLSVSLYNFQGSIHYLNLMVCGDQYGM